MESAEALARLEKRIEEIRKEDRDIRHERNKAQDILAEAMQARLTQLERGCAEQEAVCEQTKKAVTRLVNLMQGDPELESDGFLLRSKKSLEEINHKIGALEADKTESRTHRQQHADLPQRVSTIEQKLVRQDVRIQTVGWIAGIIWPIICGIGAYIWHSLKNRSHP